MKKTILSLILAIATTIAMATPVSQLTTLRLASFVFHEHGGNGDLTLVEIQQYPHLHFYSAADGNGFVIIAADDIVFPILGYSTTNTISATDIPANAAEWFEDYENQIKWNIEKGNGQSSEVADEWQRLERAIPLPRFAPRTDSTINTANLLTTTWGQSPNYNSQCPYDNTAHTNTLTGCVATAMAQIMKYWRHPLRGTGSYAYNCPPYGTQSANFTDTVFDYVLMPDIIKSQTSQEEIDAIALLMRRCGIAVEMEYGTDGSAAQTVGDNKNRSAESAYNEHFKYLHTVHAISLENYTDAEWVAAMKNEIDNGRPVQYSARTTEDSGHSFICCGYDNTDKLYFNWGWKGFYDGYYKIGQLNPGSDRYNQSNKAVVGIQPDTTDAATTVVNLDCDIPGAATLTGSGSYTSYSSKVSIKATAKPGYLVDGWDDHITYNPFKFYPNGGNVTHTARCSRLSGDTLGYCHDNNDNYYGVSSSSSSVNKWAIRLDSFSIAPHRQLEKLSVFFHEPNKYQIFIYYGTETEPTGTALLTYDYTPKKTDAWETVTLPSPVRIDRNKSLWIVLSWTGAGYPMTTSTFRGNPDGSWFYNRSRNTWLDYSTNYGTYGSWQIRAIFGYDPVVAVDDTQVEEIDAYSDGSQLVIENAAGNDAMVYDAAGRLILNRTLATSHESISLPSGIYFVHIANQTFKTLIK